MNYRVLNWRLEGIFGGERRYESIDAVCRELNYPRGWESLERMHAAIRKWADSARPGDVFIVTPIAAIVAAESPPVPDDMCPDCGQDGLVYGDLCMIDTLDVEQDIACPGCGRRWTDLFTREGRRPLLSDSSAESPPPTESTTEPDGDWKRCDMTCPGCKEAGHVFSRIWESPRDGYKDMRYECRNCGDAWPVGRAAP